MKTTLTQELARLEAGPHRACLVTQDKKLARAVTRTLVPRNIVVDQLERLPMTENDLDEYGFVLIDGDLDDLSSIEGGLQNGTRRNRVIIFSQNREKAHLARLLGKGNLTNFIAKNGGIREEELLITMHKLLTGEFFGMTQYLAHGTIPVERALLSSSERTTALGELETFLQGCLVSRRFVELARTAADELLMNALGRAPVAAAKAALASDDVSHEGPGSGTANGEATDDGGPDHPVSLQYACDGRLVGISVADAYGALTEERLFGFLQRCFSMAEYEVPQDTIGGGLGLYVAFRSADQFVVNIAEGARTEVICLIDIRGHLRDFEERSKSFHLFITEGESCPTS